MSRRQHDQVYTNRSGPPLGRPGNGLGDVWGGDGDDRRASERSHRPTSRGSFESRDIPAEIDAGSMTPEIVLALETLTPRQRFVVELRYGLREEGTYTVREVAELMGVHFTVVSEHERAALKRLEKALTPLQTP